MNNVIFKLKSDRCRSKAEVEHLEECLAVERKHLAEINRALEVLLAMEKP